MAKITKHQAEVVCRHVIKIIQVEGWFVIYNNMDWLLDQYLFLGFKLYPELKDQYPRLWEDVRPQPGMYSREVP